MNNRTNHTSIEDTVSAAKKFIYLSNQNHAHADNSRSTNNGKESFVINILAFFRWLGALNLILLVV